jgi:hypothetical protein
MPSVVVIVAVTVPVAETLAAIDAGAFEIEPPTHLVFILGQHVGADNPPFLKVSAATEVGSVVGAAGALVDRGLRVRAERARARVGGAPTREAD